MKSDALTKLQRLSSIEQREFSRAFALSSAQLSTAHGHRLQLSNHIMAWSPGTSLALSQAHGKELAVMFREHFEICRHPPNGSWEIVKVQPCSPGRRAGWTLSIHRLPSVELASPKIFKHPLRPASLIILCAMLALSASAWAHNQSWQASPQPGQQDRPKPRLQDKSSRAESQTRTQTFLAEEVRHQLVMLADYGIFDWLESEVQSDGTVILRGQVVRPVTKSDAEYSVRRIEAVEKVVNEIEVLPLSPNDDRLRKASYRALFNSNSPLFRYAIQAVPPIHIIVKNARATLKGVVWSEMDSQLAYLKARGVSGLFEAKNELRIERPEPESD